MQIFVWGKADVFLNHITSKVTGIIILVCKYFWVCMCLHSEPTQIVTDHNEFIINIGQSNED